MYKRKSQPMQFAPLRLLMNVGEATKKIEERIVKGLEIKSKEVPSEDKLREVKNDFYKWSEYNEELLKVMFNNNEKSEEYRSSLGVFSIGPRSFDAQIQELRNDIGDKIRKLESIKDRLELIPLDESLRGQPSRLIKPREKNFENIFVVHGHDEAAREIIARFLEKLKINPIILHEQANEGKTIIEKLEKHSEVPYSIVLLTPDDVGGENKDGTRLQGRARQNVILELGYFMGKLDRKNVCALHKGSLEIPSDYLGVLFIKLDEAGGWKLLLAKELKNAGFNIDMNDIID